jgi:hypothetical protein
MKVAIIYTEQFTIDVDPEEIAADVVNVHDASDTHINELIAEHIDSIITDREWPSYTLRAPERKALVDAVREALQERTDAEEE